jgi:hypothetical protein
MVVNANYYKDASQTLLLYIVNVQLQPMTVITDDDGSMPTLQPTAQPILVVSQSSNDDNITSSKNAAIAASVLAAILIVLVAVLIFWFVTGAGAGKGAASAPSAEVAMNPMNKA